MPGFDGSGPRGEGPLTGRGMGPCNRGMGFGRGFGRGAGRGYGRGAGFGRGLGCGYGWRQSFAPAAPVYPVWEPVPITKEEEKRMMLEEIKAIEEEKKYLEEEIKALKKRIDELK